MKFFLDDQDTDKEFNEILHRIKLLKNGSVAENMNQRGIRYKVNWGASIISLRELAAQFNPNHLLALKLWNKKWRESMILATILDPPSDVSEEQMDFWTKGFENSEIAEQAVANLWVKTPFAFVKALEWCRGKKHFVRFTGIQLIGRLALVEKKAPDEMFEMYFDEMMTLAKDPQLSTTLMRTLILMKNRNENLGSMVNQFVLKLKQSDTESVKSLGMILSESIND